MFEWLNKQKRSSRKKILHFITNDADIILLKWLKINNIDLDSLDDLFCKLNLLYPSFCNIEKGNVSISDKVWNIPGYIGSVKFDKEIFAKYNSNNNFAKRAMNDAKQPLVLNHMIHFYENGIMVEINYKYSNITADTNTCQYKEFFKIIKQNNGEFDLVKDREESSIKMSNFMSLHYDEKIYSREQVSDQVYRISIFEKAYKGPRKVVIDLTTENGGLLKFSNEDMLRADLMYCSVSKPSEVLKTVIKYCEKNNISISSVRIVTLDEKKNARDLTYENNSKNNSKNVNLLEQIIKSDISLKKINIWNTSEDDLNCRVIVIENGSKESLALKVYSDSDNVFIPNEIELINYLLVNFPVIDKYSYSGTDRLETYFEDISKISFTDISDSLKRVELLSYVDADLVDSVKWKRPEYDCDYSLKRK